MRAGNRSSAERRSWCCITFRRRGSFSTLRRLRIHHNQGHVVAGTVRATGRVVPVRNPIGDAAVVGDQAFLRLPGEGAVHWVFAVVVNDDESSADRRRLGETIGDEQIGVVQGYNAVDLELIVVDARAGAVNVGLEGAAVEGDVSDGQDARTVAWSEAAVLLDKDVAGDDAGAAEIAVANVDRAGAGGRTGDVTDEQRGAATDLHRAGEGVRAGPFAGAPALDSDGIVRGLVQDAADHQFLARIAELQVEGERPRQGDGVEADAGLAAGAERGVDLVMQR